MLTSPQLIEFVTFKAKDKKDIQPEVHNINFEISQLSQICYSHGIVHLIHPFFCFDRHIGIYALLIWPQMTRYNDPAYIQIRVLINSSAEPDTIGIDLCLQDTIIFCNKLQYKSPSILFNLTQLNTMTLNFKDLLQVIEGGKRRLQCPSHLPVTHLCIFRDCRARACYCSDESCQECTDLHEVCECVKAFSLSKLLRKLSQQQRRFNDQLAAITETLIEEIRRKMRELEEEAWFSSKSVVQNSCKMNYFEKFYAQLASFMEALRGERLVMRMPNKQKLKLLDKQC